MKPARSPGDDAGDDGSSTGSPTSVAAAAGGLDADAVHSLIERQLLRRSSASSRKEKELPSTSANGDENRTASGRSACDSFSAWSPPFDGATAVARDVLRASIDAPSHWPVAQGLDGSLRSGDSCGECECDNDSSVGRDGLRHSVQFPLSERHASDLPDLRYGVKDPLWFRFRRERRREKRRATKAVRSVDFGAEEVPASASFEKNAPELDCAASSDESFVPARIAITNGRSLSSVAAGVAREALSMLEVERELRGSLTSYGSGVGEGGDRGAPSHWARCTPTFDDST